MSYTATGDVDAVDSFSPSSRNVALAGPSTGAGSSSSGRGSTAGGAVLARNADSEPVTWEGYLLVQVADAKRELEGTKGMFISYGIRAETNLAHFNRTRVSSRRRFQDFVFLRDNLCKDFPACVVAPIPDKHRIDYLTGERFSNEFIEKRKEELQTFLERICRHPTLQRSQLLRAFLESEEWHVDMHVHASKIAAEVGPSGGILDSISDTLLNSFAKVRKPDERFLEMREGLDRFEEALTNTERVMVRQRTRVSALILNDMYAPALGTTHEDLATDYEELATAIEGLALLESGITDPLNRFASTLVDYSKLQRNATERSVDTMLAQMHSMLGYTAAHKSVLKLRDQKQIDFEELVDYLSRVVAERDRLASLASPYGAGHGQGGVRSGITGFLRDRVDSLRGVDEERTRVERMQRLDGRIQALQDAVTTAHDTSMAFNAEMQREAKIFNMAKAPEMKDLLGTYADGQIDLYRNALDIFDSLIPSLERIRVD
ncbi:intercellular trafficking and secretion [Tilletia horrida]|uniref:Sorting nexin-4 n=1 Tax=Tilletia horrida TaxID=155126 RepID=A0AAN6GMH4_9BASI|nr:intercellular trafficking and secretion [Tilletia horrida]KAK0548374.1 intercellular trafficking and secretion [Tilletia horrida]KAK0563504.1 intercellular trafficking and secretion [Tilletia horrida]